MRRWLAAMPALAVIAGIEACRLTGAAFPVPFLTLLSVVVLGGAWGGRISGAAAGLMGAAFVFSCYLRGIGPPTLTGGVVQSALGMTVYAATGYLIGRLRDQRDASINRLLDRGRKLKTSLDAQSREHLRQQERIAESEARLQQAVKIAGLGYYIFDADTGRCEFCSEEHAAQHGLTPEEYCARVFDLDTELALLHPDDRERVRQHYAALRERGEPLDIEYRIVNEDGSQRNVREVAEVTRDSQGRISKEVGASLDITALRAVENRLHQSQKMEAVGKLTAGVAHDFNNLLAVIMGNLELLQEAGLDADRQELASAALKATKRGADLSRQLLAFGRKSILLPQVTHLSGVIDNMSHILRRTLPANVTLIRDLAPDLWPINVDPSQLESALLNISINARDAMPDGGMLTISARNVNTAWREPGDGLQVLSPGRYVRITMQDTGSGMEESVRAQAFDPFFTTKEVGEGSGLGLSMVLGFTEQSGGAASISSDPGQGTTIEMYFPAVAPGAETEAPEAATARAAPMAEPRDILVVEDSPEVRAVITAQLRRLGHKVSEAETGDEALVLLSQGARPALMVTDIVMPGRLQGVELASKAIELQPELKVIFMSGYPRDAWEIADKSLHQAPMLMKPVSSGDLAEAVSSVF